MTCYYRSVGNTLWISSSPELLRCLPPPLPETPKRIEHTVGMDWFPPPASGVPGVRRLLPSQTLGLDGALFDAAVSPIAAGSYQPLISELKDRLITVMRNLGARGDALWLALSGGRDSRTILAAAAAAGVRPTTFTFDRIGLSRADRELPPRLARILGFDHHFVPVGRPDPTLLSLVDRHTALHCVDVDRTYIAAGSFENLPRDVVTIAGSVIETGKLHYRSALPTLPETPGLAADAILAALPTAAPDAIAEWTDWLFQSFASGVDWRDRFYIDQRLGGWLGSIAQAIDITGRTRLYPASCSSIVGRLIGLPAEHRRQLLYHDDLISAMAPELLRLPFNPRGSRLEGVRARVDRERALFRSSGDPWTYLMGRSRAHRSRRRSRRR
jgi:hypothetical protein